MRGEPIYRGILGIDIEGFNRPEWTDPTRARLRARLHRLVDQAIAVAEIALSSTVRTDTGDGLWLLVSSEVSTARLLHPLVSRLASGLAGDNQQVPAAERLRLRVAVHAGEVLHDPYGHTGASFNHAARLLDAEATRAVLAASPTADVVLVVSDTVYEGVVRHGYEGIDPAGWQPIRLHAKETATRAWVHLPGLAAQPPLPAALVASRVGPPSLPIPRELPFPPTDFTGRGGELADLRALIATGVAVDRAAGGVGVRAGGAGRPGPVAIIAIDGMGGIGKSALALQIAHQLADAGAFPDGQLYVNLHGATPGLAPLAPLDALGRLLRALGVDPAAVPTEVEEAAARFRSLAAERRLLILLDNADSPRQVRPLLPGSPTCTVLVTSRQVLATLEGARSLHLDVLPPEHALALLGRIVGEQRLVADPGAAAEVVRRCGRLPLALRIAGARLAARPAWPVQVLAEQLADATHRLEELTVGELAVRASFDVSLRALQESPDPVDRAAAAAFGLCSLPDGPDLSLAAAVRLLDRPEPATHALLERLVDAQLLESLRPGRYRFHDLVRLYAREHATGQHPEPERLAALARLFGFYTATAWHIMTLLDPGNPRPATADPRWTGGGLPFTDELVALAWLETERANLLAAIAQAAQAAPAVPAELAGQLTRALYGLFETRGYWQDGLQGNRTAQASAHEDLGVIYLRLGRYADAITSAQASLALHRKLGDRQGQADSLNHLAVVYRRLGRFAEASTCVQESLVLSRELGDRHGQDNSLASLGRVYGRVGRFVEAINCLQESLVLSRELRNRSCQADSLQGLGIVHGRQGRFVEAIACLQESLTLRRELGEHHGQAEALRDLGDALQAGAQQQQAEAAWQEALIICEALQLPEAEELRGRLAALPPGTPEPAGGR